MSMRAVSEKHIEEGYVETTYFCAKCGAEIGKFRDYAGEVMIINWGLIRNCACGERLVREVVQIVPDISESSVIEVKGGCKRMSIGNDMVICPECDGHGRVKREKGYVDCLVCKGEGRLFTWELEEYENTGTR